MRFPRHFLLFALLSFASLGGWYYLPALIAIHQLRNMGLNFDPDSFVNAACKNDQEAINAFVRAGMDVRAATPSGLTALHCAAAIGNIEMISLLLKEKCVVDAQTADLQSPLHKAVGNSHEDAVRLLLDNGADVNLLSNVGPPIFYAAANGNDSLIQLLIDKGANVSATDNFGGTALNAAIDGVRFESTVRFLLDKGVSPNGKSRKGPVLLRSADDANISLLLLSRGADPNITDGNGSAALHAAVQRNNMEMIEALLAAGARVDIVSKLYGTPLHQAAGSGNVAIAELLLKRGTDVNALDCCNGITPLHVAVAKTNEQSLSMTSLLLRWGADPNVRDKSGRSPLIEARNASIPVVQELVSRGADVNARDNQGYSALWWFRNRNSPASSYLVSKGAML